MDRESSLKTLFCNYIAIVDQIQKSKIFFIVNPSYDYFASEVKDPLNDIWREFFVIGVREIDEFFI